MPQVSSAKDVAEKGTAVGANQAVLLKKMEELTLHLIKMEKEIKELKQEEQKMTKLLKISIVFNDQSIFPMYCYYKS